MIYKVIPAILTDTLDDFENKLEQIDQVADMVQIDYVDGFFAPELTCCEARVIREVETLALLEAHLMVEQPINQVEDWYQAGAERIVGHIEEMEEQLEFVEAVNAFGVEVGLALNLETPLGDLHPDVVEGLDVVLLLAHEAGVQGAKLDRAILPKISELRRQYPSINIEVDGGVNEETIVDVLNAGANYFAVGSEIFDADDPAAEYQKLVELVAKNSKS